MATSCAPTQVKHGQTLTQTRDTNTDAHMNTYTHTPCTHTMHTHLHTHTLTLMRFGATDAVSRRIACPECARSACHECVPPGARPEIYVHPRDAPLSAAVLAWSKRSWWNPICPALVRRGWPSGKHIAASPECVPGVLVRPASGVPRVCPERMPFLARVLEPPVF